MRTAYDQVADLLDIEFVEAAAGSVEARPRTGEIIANYLADGQLAGLEILDASRVRRQQNGRVAVELATTAPAR
jgi:uncharacterized protein YuzE